LIAALLPCASGGVARIIEMGVHRVIPVLFVSSLFVLNGCSSQDGPETERHRHGAKVNVPDFVKNTFAYKGKSITLELKVEEDGVRSQGRSLRDYVGKDVPFTILGPKREQIKLVIAIPEGVTIPDDPLDEVFVTFVCAQGNLRQGNKARLIEK
jgi:hypothetical protein